MAGEVASMFVRIRPNTAGFKSETEAGVRSGVAGIAKIVGVAFGAAQAFEFGKNIVEHAASVQKQIEAVKSGFGAASEQVLKFNESADQMGLSAHAADTVSARFAILFKQIGISPGLAAKMTVGFEQLGTSIAAIRGLKPEDALRNLPLAAAGNVRSLKQLGISVDGATLKVAAFKLGLTSSVNQALSPAQRAIAIYAVATAHLGEFQKQAAAHSGDLLNRVRVLSAEWDNAKDRLGKGLLPVLVPLVNFLARYLPAAIEATVAGFRMFGQSVGDVAKAVRPVFAPLAREVGRISDAFKGGGIHGALERVKKDFEDLSPTAKVAVVALGAVAAALVAVTVAAFPITSAILAVAALGVGFQAAKQHSSAFRAALGSAGDFIRSRLIPGLKSLGPATAPAFAQLTRTASAGMRALGDIFHAGVAVVQAVWSRFGDTIKTIVHNDLDFVVRIVRDRLQAVEGVFKVISGVLHGDWQKALDGLKEIATSTLDSLLAPFELFGKNLAALFQGIWRNIELVTIEGLTKVLDLFGKIPTSIKIPGIPHIIGGHKIGGENPAKAASEALKQIAAGIRDSAAAKELADAASDNMAKALEAKTRDPAVASAVTAVADNTKKTLNDKLSKATSDGLSKGVDSGVNAGLRGARSALDNAKTALAEAITQRARDIADAVAQSKQNLISIGQSLAASIGQVMDEPFRVAAEHISLARARIALEFDRANAPLDEQMRKLSRLQAQISALGNKRTLEHLQSSFLLPGGKPLGAGQAGVAQIEALLKHTALRNRAPIEEFLLKYKSALIQVQQDSLGGRQATLDAARQRKESVLNLRSDAIAVGQGVSTLLKDVTTRAINDMTVALNTGELRIGGFYKRLNALLRGAHVNVKRAQQLLGPAFASLFEEQLKAVAAQAAANAAGPQRPGTGQAPTITHPLWTMQKDTAKIARLSESVGNKTVALQNKIEKNTKKAADNAEKLANVQLGPSSKGLGKQSRTSKDLSPAAAG